MILNRPSKNNHSTPHEEWPKKPASVRATRLFSFRENYVRGKANFFAIEYKRNSNKKKLPQKLPNEMPTKSTKMLPMDAEVNCRKCLTPELIGSKVIS